MNKITPQMATALMKFQSSVPKIELDATVKIKTKTGSTISYDYATLGNILDKIRKPLEDAGLTFYQVVDAEKEVLTTTIICVEDGTSFQSTMKMSLTGDPKQIGGNITYFRRYSLVSALGIVAEDDKDHETTGGNDIPELSDKGCQEAVTKILQGQEGLLEKLISLRKLSADQVRRLVNAENEYLNKNS